MARILILGAGIFGALAASEAKALGHDPILASRRAVSPATVRADATDAAAVARAIRETRADAVLQATGFAGRSPGAALAAREIGVPYGDISDDREFSRRVAAIPGEGSPLLTGMSTAPAVAEALVAIALRRTPDAIHARAALFIGGANPHGREALEYGLRSRLPAAAVPIDFPGIGSRRAYLADAPFAPLDPPGASFRVAISGLAGIGWRLPALARAALPVAARLPHTGGTAGSLVVDLLDGTGRSLVREGVFARVHGQRLAVLPALWAIGEALGGRAPPRAATPSDWVEPFDLLGFLEAHGFTRASA